MEKPQQFLYLDASRFSPLSRRIVHYLEAHCEEELSLDALAAAMDYNKTYLCAAFKKDTGQTILDCQNMIRIRRAAELIVYSDHSLVQVSHLCGFSSVSHFNRVFLKYAGITPGQARRAYPADILFGSHKPSASQADQFMYSVLAQKRITPEMTRGPEVE
jgi:AraC-like DNA-binding protein